MRLSLGLFLILLQSVDAWIVRPLGRPSVTTKRLANANNNNAVDNNSDDTDLFLYNSLTRSKQRFQPQSPNRITMYTCGPTVYDYAHVGNFRAFLTYDLVKRTIQYLNKYPNIVHVCNLTDIDDKIINRANERGLDNVQTLTRKYEQLFMDDLKALNIILANEYPRATEHIDSMMEMIRELHKNGLAYETSDGSWYFDTTKQPGYGQQLVNNVNNNNENENNSNQDNNDSEKRNMADFCLWKAFKEGIDRQDCAWQGENIALGRPGWHLECSAMSRVYFGDNTIDLHGGGVDLKFPHHENEIAQSEGVMNVYSDNTNGNHRRFCACWFHNGFVNIDNEKMSKSLGNFLTLQTACPTAIQVRAYRYLVISSQYRNPLSFSTAAMDAAKNAVVRIDKVKAQIENAMTESTEETQQSQIATEIVPQALKNFKLALADDLSMPRAAASLFTLVKAAENEFKRIAKDDTQVLDVTGLEAILNAMLEMDKVFGIFYTVPSTHGDEIDQEIPSNVIELVSQRSMAKDAKDWALADSLRARITELGYTVKDVKDGEPIVSRVDA